MALEIVPQEYSLDEKVRLSLLPPPLHGHGSDLSAREASGIDHPEICSGTPRSAALRILRRDLANEKNA